MVLLNVELESGRGEELLQRLTVEGSAVIVAVLTGCEDPEVIARALRRGVVAWMSKAEPIEQVVWALRTLQAGDCYVPPRLLGPALQALAASLQPAALPGPLASLTPRERVVLACMVDGCTRAEIAHRLACSPNTVRTHTQNLLPKLGVHTVVEAVAVAMRLGLRPEAAERPRQMK